MLFRSNNGIYYGVTMPEQLKQDLLFSAYKMGFADEQVRYEGLLNTKLQSENRPERELILLLEEGSAPIKEETGIFLSNAGGIYQYRNPYGQVIDVPFDNNYYGISSPRLQDFRFFKISLPAYRITYQKAGTLSISYNGNSYEAQPAENFNVLALRVLDERYLEEIAKAMARYITKKLAEGGTAKLVEGMAESKNKKSENGNQTEADKKKNREKAESAGEIAGMLVNIFSTLSEKADTRSWMSLPASVSYARIPLSSNNLPVEIRYKGTTRSILPDSVRGSQIRLVYLR